MIRDAISETLLPLLGKALMNVVLQFALFLLLAAMFVGFVISL